MRFIENFTASGLLPTGTAQVSWDVRSALNHENIHLEEKKSSATFIVRFEMSWLSSDVFGVDMFFAIVLLISEM